jgi:hypothetical protein
LKNNNTSLRIPSGTFLAGLISSHAMVLEKKLKMFRSIRGRGINNCFKKTQHFFRTPREIIVACLVTRHHAACIASEDENVKSLRHTDG